MKEPLFISYSKEDFDKVKLIEKALATNVFFKPLVIERIEEPNKALVTKVKEGIKSAKIIVPILTKRSITAQWINQEIGYSFCLDNKRVIPIVDKNIIDDLKGFIHKQNHIPFFFMGNLSRAQENKSFMSTFRKLLIFIEKQIEKEQNPITKTSSSKYALDIIDEMNLENMYKKNRTQFLRSDEGIEASKREVLKMFDELDILFEAYKNRGIEAAIEKDPQNYEIAFKANGFSFSIAFGQDKRAVYSSYKLFVKYWKGYIKILNPHNFGYSPSEKPIEEYVDIFTFDRLKDSSFSWLSSMKNDHKNSNQIIEMCAIWLAKQIKKSNG